jgi:3-phosphoshikimate 1-carboxyvinyltransferase
VRGGAAPDGGSGPTSILRGLSSLAHKESHRLLVLESGLRALGLSARAAESSLAIGPPTSGRLAQGRIELDPQGDHRMAFAFALLGLARGEVEVLGADCVEKTWPAFWSELDRLSVPPGVGSAECLQRARNRAAIEPPRLDPS